MSSNNDLDSTKARIIEAAGTVFAQKGFEAATIREICQLAQANLAAVNYHFGDKNRLYIEAVKCAHRWRIEQMPLPDWAPGTPAEQRLRDFVRTFLQRILADDGTTWHTQLMLREMAQPNSACEELVSDSIRPQFEMLLAILDELLPADTPPTKRHLIAFSIVGQCLHYRFAAPVVRLLVSEEEYRSYEPELLAEHITGWSLAALGVSPMADCRGGSS